MKADLHDSLETVFAVLAADGTVAGVWPAGDPTALGAWAAERGLARLRALTYPLPAALAEEVTAALRSAMELRAANRQTAEGRETKKLAGALATLARRELRRWGLPDRFRGEEWRVTGEGLPLPDVRAAVRAALEGRRLLASEVARFTDVTGRLFPETMSQALTLLRLSGEVESTAAVGRGQDGVWRCRRCGGTRIQPTPCANCGDPACPLCPECLLLGEARACRRLYFRPRRGETPPLGPAGGVSGGHLGGRPGERLEEERLHPAEGKQRPPAGCPLTPAQHRAARELLAWLEEPSAPREALLWAVTGAGKTTVVRPIVERAVSGGWAVLYASPRRQVVRQVAADLPRSGFTLATTHQALRYQEAFDFVLLDEPDAYPYRGNPLLQAALRRAMRPGARWLYLTATPDPELVARADVGAVRQVLLPERFHGQPPPVPCLLTSSGSPPEGHPPGIAGLAAELIRERLALPGRRILVFAPTVALCHQSCGELAKALPVPVGAVHASAPERDALIAAFRRGGLRVLVSTSVLERGVTFPSVDVVVLHADHPLFDRVGLLQMAGRAGRTAEDPTGGVWFLAEQVSPEMAAARKWAEAPGGAM